MQQRFDTRKYSVRDFDEWNSKGDLRLAPEFQRNKIWNDKARSYLIDTILRGKPIPKIYMRQLLDVKSRKTTREVVDGQQAMLDAPAHRWLAKIESLLLPNAVAGELWGGCVSPE